eukprot:gene41325-55896_t
MQAQCQTRKYMIFMDYPAGRAARRQPGRQESPSNWAESAVAHPMLFTSPEQFHDAPRHAVTVFGMAGVGKTRLAALLRQSQWFHYSVDYRIGTRHMGEFIVDNFKAEAMKVPFLRDLLRSDSIKIESNITFSNLAPLSTYLGRPGDPKKGGLPLDEYRRRQEQHRVAEIGALQEV